MGKYHINAASRIDAQLLQHTRFLSNVSIKATRRFRDEYAETLRSIRDNPYQFPFDTDRNLPENFYRKAIFARRYKALFYVSGDTVYLDAVVDCRMDVSNYGLS